MILLSEVWNSETGWWLAIILGVIGSGIIGVWIYRATRPRKQITYQILSDAPIVNIDKKVEGKVRITYGDSNNEINDANLVSFKVWNSGNTDIKVWSAEDERVEDFEVPIRFIFEGRTVVSLTELETDPLEKVIENIDYEKYTATSFPTPDSIGLPHCLLKPRQSISLSVLVKGSKGEIIPNGKLFQGNIKKFDLYGQPTTIRIVPIILPRLSWLLPLAIFSVLFVVYSYAPEPFKTISQYIGGFLALAYFMFFCLAIILLPISFIKDLIQGKKKIKIW